MTEIGIYDALLIPFIVGLLEQISIWNIWKNSGAKIMMLVCLPHSIDVFHTVIEYCQLAVGKWREQKSQNKTSSMRKSLQYFELWWIERLGHCINVFFLCVKDVPFDFICERAIIHCVLNFRVNFVGMFRLIALHYILAMETIGNNWISFVFTFISNFGVVLWHTLCSELSWAIV